MKIEFSRVAFSGDKLELKPETDEEREQIIELFSIMRQLGYNDRLSRHWDDGVDKPSLYLISLEEK